MTDITELAQMKGQKVEGSYYLAECTDCGKMYPSNKLNGGEPLFSGDYGECYCPHCNADDAAIGDCGDTAAIAWNYQQGRIDALVEALEKAQSELAKANGVLDKIQSTSCHADTSDGSFIPNSLDAWGRPVPQHLPYDFSGNPGASATQYCNGWNDAGGYWLNYVRELESRTVTVKLLDCDLAAVQHMSGGSKDYCNGFVDGTQNAIRAMRAAGVDVREAE